MSGRDIRGETEKMQGLRGVKTWKKTVEGREKGKRIAGVVDAGGKGEV